MIIAILLSSLVLYVKGDDHPVVTLPLGSVKGVNLISRNGKSYSAFMGLPYAKKPEKFEVMRSNQSNLDLIQNAI